MCVTPIIGLEGNAQAIGILRYLKLGAGPLSIDRINYIESFTVFSRNIREQPRNVLSFEPEWDVPL